MCIRDRQCTALAHRVVLGLMEAEAAKIANGAQRLLGYHVYFNTIRDSNGQIVANPNAENTKPASDDKAFLTITDDTGRTVVLPEKPERVVSLATVYSQCRFDQQNASV